MESSQSRYTNIAFISYKREDEQWAKWLQKKLENYRIPASIKSINNTIPDRVRPVFRDTTDFSGGVLKAEIQKGLAESKFLIVICSPKAAISPWVSMEVQSFIDMGREEFIIPFIVDGEPLSSNPVRECFPAPIRSISGERELLGINIAENGKESALVKVIAKILDVQFDILWNRYERSRKKEKKIFLSAISFGVFLLLILCAVLISLSINRRKVNQSSSVILGKNSMELIEKGDWESALRTAKMGLYQFSGGSNTNYSAEAECAYHLATALLLNSHTGMRVDTLNIGRDNVSCIAFNQDGSTMLVGTHSGEIFEWDCRNRKEISSVVPSGNNNSYGITSILFVDNANRIFASNSNGDVYIYCETDNGWIEQNHYHLSGKEIISISTDKRMKYLVASPNSDMFTSAVIDLNSGDIVQDCHLTDDGCLVSPAVITSDGETVYYGFYHHMLKESTTGEDGNFYCIGDYFHDVIPVPLKLNHTETLLGAYEKDCVSLYKLDGLGRTYEMSGWMYFRGNKEIYIPAKDATCFDFCGNGRIVTGHRDGSILVRDIASAKPIAIASGFSDEEIRSVTYQPDYGAVFAVTEAGNIFSCGFPDINALKIYEWESIEDANFRLRQLNGRIKKKGLSIVSRLGKNYYLVEDSQNNIGVINSDCHMIVPCLFDRYDIDYIGNNSFVFYNFLGVTIKKFLPKAHFFLDIGPFNGDYAWALSLSGICIIDREFKIQKRWKGVYEFDYDKNVDVFLRGSNYMDNFYTVRKESRKKVLPFIFEGNKSSEVDVANVVDLGLSVKWASCNLDATSPEDYGGSFSWEESASEINLDFDKEWRIPSDEEWTELRMSCIWLPKKHKHIKGYEVIGPNGNHIFIPYVNFGDGYWSSTSCQDKPNNAWSIYFSVFVARSYSTKSEQLLVRPVHRSSL